MKYNLNILLCMWLMYSLFSCAGKQETQQRITAIIQQLDSAKFNSDTISEIKLLNTCNKFTDPRTSALLKKIKLCDCSLTLEDTSYAYPTSCDPEYIKVYPLQQQQKEGQWFLVEIKGPFHAVGTGGWHYHIYRMQNDMYEKMKFFIQGYLDSTYKHSTGYYDLEFNTGGEYILIPDPKTGKLVQVKQVVYIVLKYKYGVYSFDHVTKYVHQTGTSEIAIKKYDKEYDRPEFWKFINE